LDRAAQITRIDRTNVSEEVVSTIFPFFSFPIPFCSQQHQWKSNFVPPLNWTRDESFGS
jgi:hypothetical protein